MLAGEFPAFHPALWGVPSFDWGILMNARHFLVALALAGSFAVGSCSGPKIRCVTNCVVTGSGTVSITLYDTPPTGLTLLSFTLPITGMSLTPSAGGSDVPVTITTSSVETTHLQTDSAIIADAVSITSGGYSTLKVTLGPTTATSNVFINASGSTITWTSGTGGSCANGAVCHLPASASFTISIPLTFSLSDGGSQWIGLNLNLNNAITSTGGLNVDFSQSGVLTARTTARLGIPSGSADTIEDFVGSVSSYASGSSITVKSGISGQSITAILNGNTEYNSPDSSYSGCTAAPGCINVGSTVSIDALLSSSGTLTARAVDVLDTAATDELSLIHI